MCPIITSLYRWGAEKNTADRFSVAPGPWCLFTRFSPCQCEKAPFTGKQHTLVTLLQMTHILKPWLFECPRHVTPPPSASNATRHLPGEGEACIRGVLSPLYAPAPDRLGWTGKAVVQGVGFKAGNCIRWSKRWAATKRKG